MPIKHAALKAWRQSQKAAVKNRQVKQAIKKLIKTIERAIGAQKFDEAKTFLSQLAKTADKAARRSIIKPNKANRLKSRLAKKLKLALNKK